MPRVQTKKKNKAGEGYSCDRCADKIVAGEQYYEWAFRYGGTHRQHVKHGRPKASQLTQSKMSGVYAAQETALESIEAASDAEELKQALEECATEVETVKDEYQESFDNIPEQLQQGGPAQEMQEKIDALDSFINDLQNADFNDFDEDEPQEPTKPADDASPEDKTQYEEDYKTWETEHAEWVTKNDEHLDEIRSEARDIVENLSI